MGNAMTPESVTRSVIATATYVPLEERGVPDLPAGTVLPGVLADATDRYDLIRAIRQCDRLIDALAQTRAIHSANLCRVANRLAFGGDSE